MTTSRIALANIRYPATPEESVALSEQAIGRAGAAHADLLCFPECFVPGYRAPGKQVPPPDAAFLERAWATIAAAAARANVAVILGTERFAEQAEWSGLAERPRNEASQVGWLANRSSFGTVIAHLRASRYGGQPPPAFMSGGWCERGDSNPHDLAIASPSSWCVCQFRHFREEGAARSDTCAGSIVRTSLLLLRLRRWRLWC